MIELPCKKNKCILFPTCISKHVIKCRELTKFFNIVQAKSEKRLKANFAWHVMRRHFPNLISVSADEVGGYTNDSNTL